MFFRRAKPGQPDAEQERPSPAPAEVENPSGPVTPPSVPGTPVPPVVRAVAPLPAYELRRTVDPARLGIKTTSDLEPALGLIGQERALKAIEFGADIRARDFNIFVLGPPASGKSTAVTSYLEPKARGMPAPPDWVYVHNFEDANRPRALSLPRGQASLLARAMIETVDELRTALPAAFEGEHYQVGRRAIEEEFRSGQEEAFEALKRKAEAQNIAIMRTPNGFGMAPMHEGKVVKPEVFHQLPDNMRREVETRVDALQRELGSILETLPKTEKVRRTRLRELNEEVGRAVVAAALDDVKARFAAVDAVRVYLDGIERDLIHNVGLFLTPAEDEQELVKQSIDVSRDPRFRRYMVNVMVAGGEKQGAPVHEEINPTHGNVIGRVEHVAQMGALITDFLLIKPGALHRANGGFLLIDVRKLLIAPFAWEALKRTLKAGEIRIEQPVEAMGLISSQTLDPEPIPLDIKVILLGDRELYYLLSHHDPDFCRLFKVQADFDDAIPRSPENDLAYARLIASIVARHELLPVDAGGVARLIEEGARLADDREKMSIEIGRIGDLVREASYRAKAAGRGVTTRADVARAIEEQIQRADRIRDRAQETIGRGIVLVDTEGGKAGQINGLSVLQLGNFAFGRPSRITARVRFGAGRVTDIEREVKLGGPLHSKGIMILWGYLAGRYAQDVPLALAATIVFEQSYGGVDGDSASSAELYALISALADVPIRQGLAVTGSVNQRGEVQAIGGVNEKIEGFFDICKTRGLSGEQGVLVPRANVQHLMLREDVVAAVAEGRFAVWAVETIDEGIELLTGLPAGAAGADGRYPEGTVNRLVEDKLAVFAERMRALAAARQSVDMDTTVTETPVS